MARGVGHVNVIGITGIIEIGRKITTVVEAIEDRTVVDGTNAEVAATTTIVAEAVITEEEEEMEATTTDTTETGDPAVMSAKNLQFVIAIDAIDRTRKARHPQVEVAQYPLRVAPKRIANSAANPDPGLHRRPRNTTNKPNKKAPNP